jgi:sugar lactone lactonase YvrE
VVANNGNIYVTSPDGIQNPSKLCLIRPGGKKIIVDEGLRFANGLTLSPDQTQLYVTESASHWVWVYQVQDDGALPINNNMDGCTPALMMIMPGAMVYAAIQLEECM